MPRAVGAEVANDLVIGRSDALAFHQHVELSSLFETVSRILGRRRVGTPTVDLMPIDEQPGADYLHRRQGKNRHNNERIEGHGQPLKGRMHAAY